MNAIRSKFSFVLAAAALGLCVPLSQLSADVEWEERTPYYEDDAWYDVSEWFDGNDYNPTDEAFGRWDDETYDAAQDIGTDQDNDTWYGYGTRDDNDWFYDYYDPGDYTYYYGDTTYFPYTSRYYDYDNDGIYDAFVSYTDWDRDGLYDDVDYYFFTDKSNKRQQQRVQSEQPSTAKQQSITGTLERGKEVQTRSGNRLIAQIKQKNRTITVDLGPTRATESLNLKKGAQVTVKGPMTKVGQKEVIVATTVEANGKQQQIDRTRNQITGEVVDTRKTKLRGQSNLVAIVDAKDRGKVAVDLGPARQLEKQVKKGEKLTFSGVPVKVKDKQLMMAQSVKMNGKTVQIHRQADKQKQQPTSLKDQSGRDRQ